MSERPASAPAAAVFDLDGVVTFTAEVHFAAWKSLFDTWLQHRAARFSEPFHPFEADDYRRWVDGRPRLEGVRAFLASRGLTLPEGRADDPPDRDTLWGLGHRKNALFQQQVHAGGVGVDEHAVRLIRELRAAGLRIGMASSSRNADLVLGRAGLLDLFDARTDGVRSAQAGLRGKPAPDIYLDCLAQLGDLTPAQSLLVEDAGVGVAAGRMGGFGLVIGIDRGGSRLLLHEQGADWVVDRFTHLGADDILRAWDARPLRRPHALGSWRGLSARLDGRRPALFLDYDGTLTPIVDRPDLARLSDAMRRSLEACARVFPTVIVSGRGRDDVAALVGLDRLIYAGSHGFDVAGPSDSGIRLEVDPALVPLMDEVAREARHRTDGIPGILVEDKRFSVAVHYRLVSADRVADVEAIVDALVARDSRLRKTPGKMVFEVRPAREWNKGTAVLWLLEALGLDTPDVLPIFIGDDTTDEDAFRALATRGLGIVVMDIPRPTTAHYAIQDVTEVGLLLDRLASLRGPASMM
jgi:trehalose-phosphatase